MFVAIIGTAGSGKTSLVASYSEWLEAQGYRVARVNLDPGAEEVPYHADFDVRSMFTVSEIMRRYGLGPNGALIKASDLIARNVEDILKHRVFRRPRDFVLIDTPGQMEIFVFRASGPRFIEGLKTRGPVVGVFLVDGELVKSPVDLVVAWLTGLVVQMKMDIPVVPVVNKMDLVEDVGFVKKLIEDPFSLRDEIAEKASGLIADVALDLAEILGKSTSAFRLVGISATGKEGFEELHSLVHEAFCTCGDLS